MFETLKQAYESDQEKLKALANILYHQALLIEGLAINDPVAYANDIWKVIQ
jgi:molecular chaperone HtpG